jgi:carbonic anhydrase
MTRTTIISRGRWIAPVVAGLLSAGCSSAYDTGHGETDGGATDAGHAVEWTYEGATGPAQWSTLDPAFSACSAGRNQSPIDLFSVAEGSIVNGGLDREYASTELLIRSNTTVEDILDNGHTIQVDQAGASFINLNGLRMDLVQFHFHAPSEHTVEGRQFPLEIHFVHSSSDGVLGVIGMLVEEGETHAELAKVVANLPAPGETLDLPQVAINPQEFGSGSTARYRYSGSLTTPPCSEGVRWVVARDPIQASAEQISAIADRMPTNNRPIQPLNGRMVLRVIG